MSYEVLVTFTECDRIYKKDTITSFEEWPEADQTAYIPRLINLGWIEENTTNPEPIVLDAPPEQAE